MYSTGHLTFPYEHYRHIFIAMFIKKYTFFIVEIVKRAISISSVIVDDEFDLKS